MQKNKRAILKALNKLRYQSDKQKGVEAILDAVVDLKNFNVNRREQPNRKLRAQIASENTIVNAYQNLCLAETLQNQKTAEQSVSWFVRSVKQYLKSWR